MDYKATNEELVTMIQDGSNVKENLERLYLQNIGLIEKVIRRYSGIEEREDLRQEAFIGMVKAARLWDPEKGANFSTYYLYWIKQTVQRYIDNCVGVVRVSVSQRQRIRQYNRIINEFRVKFGRMPTALELAAALEISSDQLEDLEKDIQALRIRSTSEPIGADTDDLTLEDTLPACGDLIEDMIEKIQHEELSSELWLCVDELKPKQAACIRGQFKDGLTLKECGDALGVSIERARRLKEEGLRELRKPRFAKRLRVFLSDRTLYSQGLNGTSLTTYKRTGTSAQERIIMWMEELNEQKMERELGRLPLS